MLPAPAAPSAPCRPAFAAAGAAACAALVSACLLLPATAQELLERIDRSQLEEWRLSAGNTIRFCLYEGSTTAAFDRAVAEAVAERLLLSSAFVPLPEGYAIGGEFAGDDLYIALVNQCDAAMGLTFATDAYSVEFTVTRPYVGFAYVLVVADPAIGTLEDIPRDARIGTQLSSYGEFVLNAYLRTRPASEAWTRLPYGDPALMLERLRDGTLAGMVVFGPTLLTLVEDRPDRAEGLKVLPLEVGLTPYVNRGGVLLARSAFLRIEIDQAIADMVADGTIAELLARTGLDAVPAVPGGV